MTKDEIVEKLTELGIEFDETAKKADLEALLPDGGGEKEEKDEATVTWRGGTRTYTREIHGDDFRALAEEFAGKKGGVVV